MRKSERDRVGPFAFFRQGGLKGGKGKKLFPASLGWISGKMVKAKVQYGIK